MEKIFERHVDTSFGNALAADNQDPESMSITNFPPEMAATFAFSNKTIRHGFIRKVYSILVLQLLVTFGFVVLFTFQESIKNYIRAHTNVAYGVSSGVCFICICIATFCNLRHKTPFNYIWLFICTLAMSFAVATVSCVIPGEKLLMAVGACIAVCLVLTVFAMQTKWDFTILTSVFVVSGVVMVFLMLVVFFTRSMVLFLVISAMGIIFFSFFLVYITQLIVGGKHKYSISPEEYIFAAFILYMHILTLFLFFLVLIIFPTRK